MTVVKTRSRRRVLLFMCAHTHTIHIYIYIYIYIQSTLVLTDEGFQFPLFFTKKNTHDVV